MRRDYSYQEWHQEHQTLLIELEGALSGPTDDTLVAAMVKRLIFLEDNRPEFQPPSGLGSQTLMRVQIRASTQVDVYVDDDGLARLTPENKAAVSSALTRVFGRLNSP